MHPDMTSALASQHRHEMTARASHHAQAVKAAEAGQTAGARPAAYATYAAPAAPVARGGRGAGVARGLLPRYRVSWSRTALSAAADGAGRSHSWVIVISATRHL